MKRLLHLSILGFTCLFFACSSDEDTLFQSMSSGETGIRFKNTLRESKEFNVLNYSYFYNGGGVAIGDINNDELPDIYFTGNLVASHLYVNKGNWEFENRAKAAGVEAAGLWNTGVTMADVNGDGWLDIYVCRSAAKDPQARRNLLFINNQDLTFTEKAAEMGLDDPAYSTQAAFFDYDRDNDLDLFLLNHSVPEYSNFQTTIGTYKNRRNPAYGDKLYRNDGGKFTDVTNTSGIIGNVLGFGLGVTVFDANNDSWLDLYVSNDFNEEDYLYINQQDGSFQESLSQYMDHVSLFSMGADAADINNDGNTDLLTLDMLPANNYRIKMTSGADNFDKYRLLLDQGFYKQTMRNMLQVNEGGKQFMEVGQLAGISNTDWSWSALFADYDLDGWQDVFITNGYLRDYTNMDFLAYTVDLKVKTSQSGKNVAVEDVLAKMPKIEEPNRMFKNQRGERFQDVGMEWGFTQPLLSNGAAYGDLDNDGDLDLVVNNVNQLASIYRNQAVEKELGQFLKLQLSSSGPIIGTSLTVYAQDQRQKRTLIPTKGYQSAVTPLIHLGFPHSTPAIDSIIVQWPNGIQEKFPGTELNEKVNLVKGKGQAIQQTSPVFPSIFTKADILEHQHKEDSYNDFKIQGLLPKFYSRQGPAMAVGDINNDGREDVIIGGAAGQSTAVFIQSPLGLFEKRTIAAFEEDAAFEDVAIEWIDVDQDGDKDVIIGSGGNHLAAGNPLYAPRLYLNDGRANFQKSEALKDLRIHASTISTADVDQDGDVDIFIGGQYEAQHYPYAPEPIMLLNQGLATFEPVDVSALKNIRISAAQWVDVNNDQRKELVMVGEWEPLRIWDWRDGEWKLWVEGKEKGWWNALHAANVDKDPELEIIVGNLGLNSQLSASKNFPIINYVGDFDQNGSVDPILTSFDKGVSYPFLPRDDILSQLPGLRKSFNTYEAYAQFTTEDLLGQFSEASADTINELATILYDWDGENMLRRSLPKEVQYSSIHAIQSLDYDQDGDIDVLLGGNDLFNKVKIGEIDANHGLLLENLGGLAFKAIPNANSGFQVKGAVRSISMINQSDSLLILWGISDQAIEVYKAPFLGTL